MDFKEIQELIKLVSKSGLTEFKYANGDTKIVIRTTDGGNIVHQIVQPSAPQMMSVVPAASPVSSAPASAAAPPAVEASKPEAGADKNSNLIPITSPIVGTFYRSTSPEKPPFVKVGDSVEKGTIVCIIEAMKLFNEIESEIKGKIVKVLVEDASPVEYGQPLFLVEP
ncbi:MAG: acetyl-CoA carboxylase biotin carboxyl carrier protein [Saprospiraceae bacterium]